MPFTKVSSNEYKSPSGRKFTKKQVKMYYATKGFTKKKAKIVVNNKLKGAFGDMNPKTNEVRINVKKHKGDKAELASTIKHEMLHVKYPKMTEKEVYKKSRKTKMSEKEQNKYLSKLKRKSINYKVGALKRKFKLDKADPGEFINKSKELSKRDIAIRGLI